MRRKRSVEEGIIQDESPRKERKTVRSRHAGAPKGRTQKMKKESGTKLMGKEETNVTIRRKGGRTSSRAILRPGMVKDPPPGKKKRRGEGTWEWHGEETARII